jgi:Rrf2 family transcriptional regulator, cysteine metabolism repressor
LISGRLGMLKISQRTEYAVRAAMELAIRRSKDGDVLVPARSLAEAQHIPLRFLEQQLGTLHKAGLVQSFRGAGGGCRLARDPATICVSEVVDAIEGPLYPMGCLDSEDHTCFQDAHCGLQELWGEVHVAIRQVFERITLADLAERHRRRGEAPLWLPAELIRRA